MSRRIALGVVLAATAVTAAACGLGGSSGGGAQAQQTVQTSGALSGSITFQTWSLKNDKFTPYFNSLIKDFEGKHPGTKISWIDQPGDGYADKVSSQITSKSLPDVVNLPPDIAHAAAKTGALLDLAKNVPSLSKDYVKSGIDAYTYPDASGSYGFPWYLGTDVNYWNSTLMSRCGLDAKKPPATFDELVSQAKTMHDKCSGKVYLMSRSPGLSDFVNAGVPLMDDKDTKFTFNTSTAVALIDKYTQAYKDGLLPTNVLSTNYEGNSALFVKQEVAWTTGTGNYIQGLEQSNPTLAKVVVPSPALDTPPLYVQGISVASGSKNLPLALAFAEFVTDNANQIAFVQLAQGYLPGTTAAASDSQFAKSDGTPQGDAAVIAFQSLAKAKNFTPPEWTDAMNTYLNQQVALAMTGKESGQQALDNAVNKANQLLQD